MGLEGWALGDRIPLGAGGYDGGRWHLSPRVTLAQTLCAVVTITTTSLMACALGSGLYRA